MIRAPLGSTEYWNAGVELFSRTLTADVADEAQLAKNVPYQPQFWFDHCKYTMRLMLLRYSRGDACIELQQYFPRLLDAWEKSNRLANSGEIGTLRRDWVFSLSNLNHYNFTFWLAGLAISLEIPDSQWHRLLTLIGGQGEDILLDRVIATRQPDRAISAKLLHPKPYARLLRTIDAPQDEQAPLLLDFVNNWYPELARKGKDELWWYIYGDPVTHPLEMGSYFGRWCIEAVAAVKAFGIDDSMCLGHEHYPSDLLRPDGPSTHVARGPVTALAWFRIAIRRMTRSHP